MISRLGMMCQTLEAINGDIGRMAQILWAESISIRTIAAKTQNIEAHRIRMSLHRVASPPPSLQFEQAARNCRNAAEMLDAARRTSAAYTKLHWNESTSGHSASQVSHSPQDIISIRAFLDAHDQTTVGSAFFAESDKDMRTDAGKVPRCFTEDGLEEYVLDLHGMPHEVYVDDDPLSAASFATVIEQTPWARTRQPIRLLSCFTGLVEDGFAQQLADRLGVQVTAPDDFAWNVPGEEEPLSTEAWEHYDFVSNEWISGPVLPPTGTWRVFHPRTMS